MHKLLAIAGIFFICSGLVAQENFEGKITYRLSFSMDRESSIVEAFFGDQKIKVIVQQGGNKPIDKEDLILDFKNGVFYKITNRSKAYTIDSFKKSGNDIFKSPQSLIPLTGLNTTHLGYKTSAFKLSGEKTTQLHKDIKATLWYADSLFFKIPEKYASVEMVPLFTNGTSIGFGLKMLLPLSQNKNHSSEFTVLSVEPKKITDSLLGLPGGYTLLSFNSTGEDEMVTDSTATVALDTVYSILASIPAINKEHGTARKTKRPG